MELIATCAFGLEKLVHDEIKKLGLWVTKTEDGRITFNGDELALIRANLWLRCADRIQIKMGEFVAQTFDELFDRINSLEWEKYIGKDDAFPVDATSVKSILHSEPAIQSIVKKSIVKRLMQKHSTEILPENSGAIYQIIVKANKSQFVVGIDSSGDSLHKRGYRTKANLAPIKETLAAALVKLSDWTPERTLVDPFCGSGTILIEAALMAANKAPGLTRPFAFHQWKWIDRKNIADAYLEANQAVKLKQELKIFGFDIDPSAIKNAQENAAHAGFKNLEFECADFNNLDFGKFENCTFIANPPYGERLEDKARVEEMYREFGKKFRNNKNCSLFLITSNENFPKLFGRPADKNRKLFNGKIRCYLFSWFGEK
jgi:putative N6-adenine-specific DNA methylase